MCLPPANFGNVSKAAMQTGCSATATINADRKDMEPLVKELGIKLQ